MDIVVLGGHESFPAYRCLIRKLCNSFHHHLNVVRDRVPIPDVTFTRAVAEEVWMKEAEQYRSYAEDCLRMAKKVSEKDKETLLRMAEAWTMRAEAAERDGVAKK